MKNTTKETRKESHLEILQNLGDRQRMVLTSMLFNKKQYGRVDMTARELAKDLHSRGLIPTPERNMVHPRLNELVELGVVEVTGKKLDVEMNRNVATYNLVGGNTNVNV